MKYVIYVLFIFLILSTTAKAQIEYGIKAGGTLSNISFLEPDSLTISYESKSSFLIGIFAMIHVSAKVKVQPEVLYTRKGYSYMHTHYMNIPIMLQYQLINRLKLEAGPEISYLVDARSTIPYTKNLSLMYMYKRVDLALNTGVDYSILDNLSLAFRYNLGVYDITKDYEVYVNLQPITLRASVINHSYQLSLAWKLLSQ